MQKQGGGGGGGVKGGAQHLSISSLPFQILIQRHECPPPSSVPVLSDEGLIPSPND